MDQFKKALYEQIDILYNYKSCLGEPDYGFVRDHAIAIVQFSDQLLDGDKSCFVTDRRESGNV